MAGSLESEMLGLLEDEGLVDLAKDAGLLSSTGLSLVPSTVGGAVGGGGGNGGSGGGGSGGGGSGGGGGIESIYPSLPPFATLPPSAISGQTSTPTTSTTSASHSPSSYTGKILFHNTTRFPPLKKFPVCLFLALFLNPSILPMSPPRKRIEGVWKAYGRGGKERKEGREGLWRVEGRGGERGGERGGG